MTSSRGERETTPRHVPSSSRAGGDGPPAWRHARLVWIVGIVACVLGASVLGVAVIRTLVKASSSSASTTLTTAVASTSAPSRTTVRPSSGRTPPTNSSTSEPSPTGIDQSFNTLFDFANGSITDKLAVVEDGANLRQAMTEALSTSFAAAATGARVDTATMPGASACARLSLTAPCAAVTYDVVGVKNAILVPSSQGYAESINGRWLVAKVTVCGLFELFYQASAKTGTPPGC
jgi:hypothetical protein